MNKISPVSLYSPLFSKDAINLWGAERDDLSTHKYHYQELVIQQNKSKVTCLFEDCDNNYFALYLGDPPAIEDENQRLILTRLVGLLIEHVHIEELLNWIEDGKALPEFDDLGIDEKMVTGGDDELIFEAKKVLGL